ncbi:arginine-glutamic acid dipeptide repeats protein [Nematostella vectensis]|nr:arginine-glutamic acid dipeptide repeats protein [Nematostella vectensis]XP_032242886.2 arginine-glutamic acid dipeptide repeats protein [Nematostella vectensis]XP_032242887.2 arginine-glutamic acid dipeptide repeats protein [Nematostella vectensis]XP_048580993.1 arginine-glutamic acid dipeptide repeats protein [Nematostella vectensis]XP_048580994.1 arginine-glutamic acid dipeptide repeats protein [Nematostella vectensis]
MKTSGYKFEIDSSPVKDCMLDQNMNSSAEDKKNNETCNKPRRRSLKAENGDMSKGDNNENNQIYTSEDDISYQPGDCVYIDSQRPDVPYFICSIKEFRTSRRENMTVTVRWYYRPSEVPESVYQLLVQDRNHEHGSKDHILEDNLVKERELFISDATDVYPVSALRGKCVVRPFTDMAEDLKQYITKEDSFFYLLGYNPETRRLANTKGEIRVGASHQAILPECQEKVPDKSDSSKETCREKLTWSPVLEDYDLTIYLCAARSMAQYAGMCNGGTREDGFRAMSQDATTSNALNVLHDSKYDAATALQVLVKKPYPKELRKKWSEDDIKKFVKGLRQFGKNFYKIHKEHLPYKSTSELVEYYYIWKKSHSAQSSRPHRRRRHNVLRRRAHTRNSKTVSSDCGKDYVDLTSCSEDDYDSDDSTERDFSLYCCRHCYTSSSRSWHHGGRNKVILCTECRIFHKKYGKLPPTDSTRDPPPYMFKSVLEKDIREEDAYWTNGKVGLRSRRNLPMVQSTLRSGRNKTSSPVESVNTPRDSPVNGRRLPKIGKPPSPSEGSTSSSGSTANKAKDKKGKGKKNKILKRSHEPAPISPANNSKRRKSNDSDDDIRDDVSESSSATGGRDSTLREFDERSECSNASVNDEVSSNRSNSPLVLPIIDPLPAKFKRVGPGEENRSCARTDVVYEHPERPKPKEGPRSSESSTANSTATRTEASESNSADRQSSLSVHRQSPKNTPAASVTSHYEAAVRNMMASGGGEYHMYPSNMPSLLTPSGVAIPGYPSHEAVDYRMLQYVYPGSALVPESRDSAAKFAEGFEQWYAPYRMAQMQPGGHHIPYQLLHGRSLEHGAMAARSMASQAQAHEALLKNAAARGIPIDPVTGLPVGYPNHHSHSHMHTHFHIHPHEQQLQAAQAAAAAANMDRAAYLQSHPGLAAWRNQQLLAWQQHPELMQLHGGALVSPEDHPHAAAGIHGLGSTPLDRQLQQQLLMSQQSKYSHPLQQQQHLHAQEEAYLRHLRHHEMQLKQHEASTNEAFMSTLFRKEHRNLQSPSQLDNVVKKNLDSTGTYTSPSKKPVTIDLSDD